MQAWQNFLTLQEAELGPDTVQKWLKPLTVLRFDACNLYLEAKDSFQALWFEEHVRHKIQTRFFNNNNKRIKVHLSIANAPTSKIANRKPKRVDDAPPSLPQSFTLTFDALNPYCTFENFVDSENYHLAFKLLCNVSGWDPETNQLSSLTPELAAFNPIYLCGPLGIGKTHLLMATAKALIKRNLKVIYVRAETFTEHVVTAIRAGEMSIFRQAYRNIDVLIIDDVHIFSRKGATQEELFHTFNTLHLAGKQIILSSHCSPGELQFIEPRLISRFEWGIVLPLESIKREESRKILEKKALVLGSPLHPKVVEFLLETFSSNNKTLTRALEALILRAHLKQHSGNVPSSGLTVPQVRNYLSDLIQEEQQAALTPQKIIKIVAEFFGIRPEDILGKAQSRDCVLPRQITMYLCRSHLGMPFMKIGDLFSKDHSTVMSSVKVIQSHIENKDPEINGALNSIQKNLRT